MLWLCSLLVQVLVQRARIGDLGISVQLSHSERVYRAENKIIQAGFRLNKDAP